MTLSLINNININKQYLRQNRLLKTPHTVNDRNDLYSHTRNKLRTTKIQKKLLKTPRNTDCHSKILRKTTTCNAHNTLCQNK